MWTNTRPRFTPASHLKAMGALALKHDMTVQFWRQLSRDGLRYRVCFVAGFHGSAPNVCWVEMFAADHPLDDALDRMAAFAWDYYAGSGYAIPDDGCGISQQDAAREHVAPRAHPRVRGRGRVEQLDAFLAIAEQEERGAMCGRYQERQSWQGRVEEFAHIRIPVVFPEPHAAPNLPPELDIRPTDQASIFRPRGDGVEMVRARWWFVPWFHRGPLKDWKLTTFNARAESVATSRTFRDAFARRRCLVAATGWYEWTGPKGGKTRWLFEPRDGRPIMLAGLWDRADTADQGVVESFTIVTQPAGSPLNGYHDRAPVVLFQQDWHSWLDPQADVSGLLEPESRDLFSVTVADQRLPLAQSANSRRNDPNAAALKS